MVDGKVMARQESGWAVSLKLCRGAARELQADQQIDEPSATESHTEPKEYAPKVEDVPQAV